MADEVHYPDGARESDTPGYYGPADEKPALNRTGFGGGHFV